MGAQGAAAKPHTDRSTHAAAGWTRQTSHESSSGLDQPAWLMLAEAAWLNGDGVEFDHRDNV